MYPAQFMDCEKLLKGGGVVVVVVVGIVVVVVGVVVGGTVLDVEIRASCRTTAWTRKASLAVLASKVKVIFRLVLRSFAGILATRASRGEHVVFLLNPFIAGDDVQEHLVAPLSVARIVTLAPVAGTEALPATIDADKIDAADAISGYAAVAHRRTTIAKNLLIGERNPSPEHRTRVPRPLHGAGALASRSHFYRCSDVAR